jgi:hypothetical protein
MKTFQEELFEDLELIQSQINKGIPLDRSALMTLLLSSLLEEEGKLD